MVMDAALHDWCAPLPGGSKRLPIYPQIPAAATGGFTAEELESLLFPPSDGVDAGGGYLNASSAPLLHQSPSASAVDIVLGYIDRMLMAEDIDEKFDHYPAHGALLAAEMPFLESVISFLLKFAESMPTSASIACPAMPTLASMLKYTPSDGELVVYFTPSGGHPKKLVV